MSKAVTLSDLRRYAIARTMFAPTTLARALQKLGFVQADPIRAPARAQDLTLRQRVKNYRAGDLERLYPKLGVEEDFFVNYGFVADEIEALMHPRDDSGRYGSTWDKKTRAQAADVIKFVRAQGVVHPRELEQHFGLGSVKNYWGGSSSATTRLLDALHYRGLLSVVRRDQGVRVYAARPPRPAVRSAREQRARVDALVDVIVKKYAPLPRISLNGLVHRLRFAVPQWREHIKPALAQAHQRLGHARIEDVDWYWPADERPSAGRTWAALHGERVRLLAPFDPLVWDRPRFELFWGWAYRFEAYTPPAKRKLGYYALPLLYGERVIGWSNVSAREGELVHTLGFVAERPREEAFARELMTEIHGLAAFLGAETKRGPNETLML